MPNEIQGVSCRREGSGKDFLCGKIRMVFPARNQSLQLANDEVAKWFTAYHPNRLGDNYGKGDHFAGKDVDFVWEYDGSADYFVLEIAEEGDFADCLCFRSESNNVKVGYLNTFTDYSWRVRAFKDGEKVAEGESCFHTEKSPRTISVDGVSNARDIAFFSKKLKQGMIYRSASLDAVTEKGLIDALSKYGIRTEIDLRNTGEGKQRPLGETVNYYSFPGSYYVITAASIKDPLYQKNMAEAMKIFADESKYPIVFHCAIGRDRTGTFAAVLESFLGADYDDIMADYEMSFFSDAGCKDESTPDVMFTRITEIYDFLSAYGKGSLRENTEKFLRDIGVSAEDLKSIQRIMAKPEKKTEKKTRGDEIKRSD